MRKNLRENISFINASFNQTKLEQMMFPYLNFQRQNAMYKLNYLRRSYLFNVFFCVCLIPHDIIKDIMTDGL